MRRPGLLVTGAPRSGTTFLGRMLALPRSIGYLDEPFNVQIGLTSIPHQFVSVDPGTAHPSRALEPGWRAGRRPVETEAFDATVDRLLSGRARFRQSPFYAGSGAVARAGRALVGSRTQLRYRLASAEPWMRRWLIKDPTACFVAERLCVRHAVPVIVVVRHPAAVVASYRRLGWRFVLNDLPAIPGPPAGVDSTDVLVEGALLWTAIYSHLASVADRNPAVVVVRHEDLSADPVREFGALYHAVGLPWSSRVARVIEAHTRRGNAVEVAAPHDLRRDSARLVARSVAALSADELAVIWRVANRVAARWYTTQVP